MGGFAAMICGRTTRLEHAQEDLRVLGPGAVAAASSPRPYRSLLIAGTGSALVAVLTIGALVFRRRD